LARDTLFRYPGVGALLRSWNAVPVDRDGGGASGLKAILDRLLSGGAIILFPEGTRTRDGNLQKAKSGIGLTVIKSDAPVVPVRIFGTFEAYGRHLKLPRPVRITVKYGRPVDFSALREEARTCTKPRLKQIYQEVADQIMAEISKLQPELDPSEKIYAPRSSSGARRSGLISDYIIRSHLYLLRSLSLLDDGADPVLALTSTLLFRVSMSMLTPGPRFL
jgi:1-acyl-sn-glycerol-3-phosphate acyltransferase